VFGDLRESSYEAAIEVAESQELAYIFYVLGFLPFRDTSYLHWVHGNSAIFQYHAQEFDFVYLEVALARFEVHVHLLESVQDLTDHRSVYCGVIFRRNQDVVNVDLDLLSYDQIGELHIHHTLEYCRRISQSKWHDHWFEESHICFEGRFMFVAFPDSDIVIPRSDVQFSEQPSVLDFVDFLL
jgi:hypothetical protein